MLENLPIAISNVFRLNNLIFINLGLFMGIIFGALPGLTATMGVALLLPMTFGMDPIQGLLMLLGIYCGAIYGGSITAILIKTPGTDSSAATLLDGYPLAQRGFAKKALEMAVTASTIAGIISTLLLLFIAPQLAKAALSFGPPEYFALATFGLSIIASVSGKNIAKALIAACIGMFVSIIGLDPIGGIPRFSFDSVNLVGGISLVPALIGLYAIAEIVSKGAEINQKSFRQIGINHKNKDDRVTMADMRRCMKSIIRSSLIGSLIGAIPGTGSTIATFISYNEAKKRSKTPEEFGNGCIEGVAAAEAGNNGVTGATLIPLLTLGIPGDSVTAVMLGALMMQGLIPGPGLFKNYGPIVYSVMVGLILVNIFMFIQGRFFSTVFAKLARIPNQILVPVLMVLCTCGAFAINNSTFDIKLVIIFGILSYFLNAFEFPITPCLLAIVLGPLFERSFRQSLLLSKGSFMIFFTRPISLVFIVLSMWSVYFALRKTLKSNL